MFKDKPQKIWSVSIFGKKPIILPLFVLGLFIVLGGIKKGCAQEKHPLSRQDSASIRNNLEQYEQYREENRYKEASRFLNKVAMTYWEHNHFARAEKYYQQSLELNKKVGNENGITMINSNIAMINSDLGAYEKAVKFFKKTLTARKVRGEKIGTISALMNLAVVLNNLERYQESLDYLHEALDIARELNNPEQMKSCYGMLAETYEKAGNSEKSMYYFNYFQTFHNKVTRDKIRKKEKELENERLKRKLAEAQKQNKELKLQQKDTVINRQNERIENLDADKRQLLDTLSRTELELKYVENMRELEQQRFLQEQERQRAVRNYILSGTGSVVIIAVLLLLGYRQKRLTAKKLAAQNKRIAEQKSHIEQQATELRQTNQRLRELFKFKEGLMSMIVHDLKHPLNTILSNSGEKGRKERIHPAAKQMERMILNILDVRKFENAKFQVELQPLALNKTISEAVAQIEVLLSEKSLKIEYDTHPMTVNADYSILVRVFNNLMTNAIKYAPAGGTIKIISKVAQENALVGVFNSGSYIPEDKQASIFEEFQQIEARDSGTMKSTGLGLTFCKMSIEAHEGSIWVESNQKQGTTFWFTLALSKEEVTDTTQLQADSEQEASDFSHPDLLPFKQTLQQYEVFEVSSIRHILKDIHEESPQTLRNWKEQVNRALFSGDEVLYNKLVKQ